MKAPEPIDSTELPISNSVNELALKALEPIEMTESGITNSVNELS